MQDIIVSYQLEDGSVHSKTVYCMSDMLTKKIKGYFVKKRATILSIKYANGRKSIYQDKYWGNPLF